ncbi:COG3063 Tfp pilus assembly protein PilF [Vibrio sp. B1REV9]|uniref:type IV pilus biogenesis/stability protein PilW n=1 Tax=Vibrio sp. B1REV9 TaxID=2751179 RepID=UPI001B2922BB|nr:type IV pilus biogenesis/stability protein PilW [Vibrio sp. B1REV9]CAE6945078.1 COG3063 Tfp pilus assembly protein PilF [Vibrio sp. B1REV9]
MTFTQVKACVITSLFSLLGCVTVQEDHVDQHADPIALSESRIALGLSYLKNGSMIQAHNNLQQALSYAPRYYRAQLSMAHYYESVGEDTKAEQLYHRALEQHSQNGDVLNNYGTFLCKKGNYLLADRLFKQAIELPNYYLIPISYENAAFCALKANEQDKAMIYFSRAIAHDPHRPKSILQLAKLEIDKGNYADARLRLIRFNQVYGLSKPSLQLMIQLENKAGNDKLKHKYQQKLDNLS